MTKFLSPVMRRKIEGSVIDFADVWGAKEGDPKRADLKAVVAAGLEAVLKVKQIELEYTKRLVAAVGAKDSLLVVAAVYGLEIALRQRRPSTVNDEDFFRSMLMRAAHIVSKGEIRKVVLDSRASMHGASRRAFIELMDEKLADLDALVAAQEPAPEADPDTAPRM